MTATAYQKFLSESGKIKAVEIVYRKTLYIMMFDFSEVSPRSDIALGFLKYFLVSVSEVAIAVLRW